MRATSPRLAALPAGALLAGLLLACVPVTAVAAPAPAAAVTAPQIVARARAAYENLGDQGLRSFRADVAFDWGVYFGGKMTPAQRQVLAHLHYTMTMDDGGTVVLRSRSDKPPKDKPTQTLLDRLYHANLLILAGTFGVWRGFAYEPALPAPNGAFTLEFANNGYRVLYVDPPGTITVTLGADYAISSWVLSSPEVMATVEPQFAKTVQGFALTGYVKRAESRAQNQSAYENVRIVNRSVRGYELPQSFAAETTSNGQAGHIVFRLSNYQLVTSALRR